MLISTFLLLVVVLCVDVSEKKLLLLLQAVDKVQFSKSKPRLQVFTQTYRHIYHILADTSLSLSSSPRAKKK